jgi:hypothetical protein
MASDPYYGSSNSAFTGVIFLVGAAFLFLVGAGLTVGGIILLARRGKVDPAARARYQQQFEAVKREHENITKGHERAIARWDQLYYCSRDDCVFIPGETTSAPLAKMRNYLYVPAPLPPAS